jgi:glycosyltransferase involved in cell wall biosynthesis
MPVYNGEEHLKLAIESLLQQDHREFELVIVDNASVDNTESICRGFASMDARIRYYRNEKPVHPMENFNKALSYAECPYFMWAAHDDIREPGFVRELLEAIENNPNAVLACCSFDNIDNIGGFVRSYDEHWPRIFKSTKFWQYLALTLYDDAKTQKANGPIYGLMRRALLIECGGMQVVKDAVFCGEDLLLLLKLLGRGDFCYVDKVLFHYRIRRHEARDSGQTVLQYLRRRITEPSRKHRGSLTLYIWRNHVLHREMRRIVMTLAPIGILGRLSLSFAITIREFWQPFKTIPASVWHEVFSRSQHRW